MFDIEINNRVMSGKVLGSTDVPIVNRNRDYTPIGSEIRISFAWDTFLGFLAEGYEVKVYENSIYPFFFGYITKVKQDYNNRLVEVTVKHFLTKGERFTIKHSALHPEIFKSVDGKNYHADGITVGCASVQVLYLLEILGRAQNITVDASALNAVSSFTFVEAILWGGVNYNIYLKDLYFSEDMLYCLNNNIATMQQNIEDNYNYMINRFTYFRLFQEICSNLGFIVYFAQSGSVRRLIVQKDNKIVYNPSANHTYKYVDDKIEGSDFGYSYQIHFNDNISTYKSSDEHALEEIEQLISNTDKGQEVISTISNLVYFYQKPTADDGKTLGMADFSQVPSNGSQQGRKFILPYSGGSNFGVLKKKAAAKTSEFVVNEKVTSFTPHEGLNALRHFVKLGTRESEIRYETQ